MKLGFYQDQLITMLTIIINNNLFHLSDDPAPSGHLEEDRVEPGGGHGDDVGGGNSLDPEQFCSCGLCTNMPTLAESFCCKSMNYLQTGGRNCFTLKNRHSKI